LLEVKGVDKVKEAQKIIDDLFGMNGKEFVLTCFFKQADINGFMELGGAKQKEHFMRWLRNTHWQGLFLAVSEDIKACQKALDNDRASQLSLNDQIAQEQYSDDNIKKQQKTIKNYKKKKIVCQLKLKALTVGPAEAKRLRGELEDIEEERHEFLTDLFFHHKELRKVDLSKEKGLEKKQEKLTRKAERLGTQIKNANRMTGTCPILDESCDRISCSETKLKSMKKVQEDLLETRTKVHKALRKIDAAKQLPGLDKINKRRKAIESRLKLYNFKVVSKLQEETDMLEKHIYNMTHKLGRMTQAKKNINKIQDSIEELEKRISKDEKKLGNLKYLAFMFGKNGIPSQEIENALNQIEEEINYVLSKFGTAIEVEFRSDRQLSTWEDSCVDCGWQFPKGTRLKECKKCGSERQKKRKDELELRVRSGGTDESFRMESGGGKTIISLATRIALTLLLRRQTGSNFNVLFLDEPDAAFDEANRDKFMKLITTVLIHELGFEQVFWISHFKDIQESIPHVLQVENKKGYSQTRWL